MPCPAARAPKQLFGRELAIWNGEDRKKPSAAQLTIECPRPPPVPQRDATAGTIGTRLKRECAVNRASASDIGGKISDFTVSGSRRAAMAIFSTVAISTSKIQRGGMPNGDTYLGQKLGDLTVVCIRQPYQRQKVVHPGQVSRSLAAGGASTPCPLEPPLMRSVARPDRRPFRDGIIGDAFLA